MIQGTISIVKFSPALKKDDVIIIRKSVILKGSQIAIAVSRQQEEAKVEQGESGRSDSRNGVDCKLGIKTL